MSTYILCGFANISSIGILLGGMGVLAPQKKPMITRFGVPAMVGGALVSVLSATIIGMILG
jgi:CNT family concentrative nucleoside transporter